MQAANDSNTTKIMLGHTRTLPLQHFPPINRVASARWNHLRGAQYKGRKADTTFVPPKVFRAAFAPYLRDLEGEMDGPDVPRSTPTVAAMYFATLFASFLFMCLGGRMTGSQVWFRSPQIVRSHPVVQGDVLV